MTTLNLSNIALHSPHRELELEDFCRPPASCNGDAQAATPVNECERLREAIQWALCHSPYREIRNLRINVFCTRRPGLPLGVCVQVCGRTSSFYMKQVAQESVRQLRFPVTIDNRVEVSDALATVPNKPR